MAFIRDIRNHAALQAKLIAWYRMGGLVDTDSVLDESANGHTGTAEAILESTGLPSTLPLRVDGNYFHCLDFKPNAASDLRQRINLGATALVRPTNISVSAWVNLNNGTTYRAHLHDSTIIANYDSNGSAIGFFLRFDPISPRYQFQIHTSGGSDNLFYTYTPTYNAWHHVTATYDGTTMKLYIDGDLKATQTHAHGGDIVYEAGIETWIAGLADSSLNSGQSGMMRGQLDDVGFFDTALAEYSGNVYLDESTFLYNSGVSRPYDRLKASAWEHKIAGLDSLRLLGTDPDAALFDPSSQNDDFTVAVWYRPEKFAGAAAQGLLSKESTLGGANNRCWETAQTGGSDKFNCIVSQDGTSAKRTVIVASNLSCRANKDVLGLFRYQYSGTPGQTSRLDIDTDGVNTNKVDAWGPINSETSSDVQLGDYDTIADRHLDGRIYAVAYWNQRLSDEIVAELEAGAHPYDDLLFGNLPDAFWEMSQTVGSDYSLEVPLGGTVDFVVEGTPTRRGTQGETFTQRLTVGPRLSTVQKLAVLLRVTFDRAMTDNSDLQDPANYAIIPLSGGVSVVVSSVNPGPGTYPLYVDLTLANLPTEDSLYELRVPSLLTDSSGSGTEPDGRSLQFLGFGSGITTLDEMGLIQGLTSIFGEELAEVGGFRMTRLAGPVTAGDDTFYVESTLHWPDAGKMAVDGVPYTYSSKIITALYGVEHVAAGAITVGAAANHREEATVTDLSRQFSGLDLLRRAFLVDYAEGEDLNVIGRNLGVDRSPIFTGGGDDQFREIVKATAYGPKATVYGLELALEALVGAGNFEIYEDLIQYPNKVFIRIDTSVYTNNTVVGRALLNLKDWDDLSGSQNTLVIGETPITTGSAILKPLDFLFDFRDGKPSTVDMAPWPGEAAIQPWSYQGGESEGTAVVNTAGRYTTFTSTTGTVYYRMSDADGARLTSKSDAEVSINLQIPVGATVSGSNRGQCALFVEDGSRALCWGVLNIDASYYRVGLYDSGGWVGNTVSVSKSFFHEITLIKHGDTQVELWVNGTLISREDYTTFDVSANHRVDFGITIAVAGLDVRYKHLGAKWATVTDYWGARGTAGSVNTANPTRFDDTATLLAAGDVGKRLDISGSGATNPSGGNNNGNFLINSYVSPGVVELFGPVRNNAATATAPDTITVENPEEFTYPDDLGKQIIITGSSLGNNGTYTIAALIESGTGEDFSDYDSPITDAKTNICEVTGAPPFVAEPNLEYQIKPVFVTETGLDWELSDAGSSSGATLTLRQGLWANGLVLEVGYTNAVSAQLLADQSVVNEVIGAGPPVIYENYPFYLADPFGAVKACLEDLTAAGVIPEFESL